jgi:eukaryotic-like serine/threonine-protein kinase
MTFDAGDTKEQLHDPDPAPSPAAGKPLQRLGDFRILREVGRGGMGVVYEAEQESLGRHVALKVLLPHALHGATQVQRFEREAKAAARLHHTNIVPVFGVGEQDGLHYYVMQFIDGRGLDQVLDELEDAAAGGRTRTTPAGAPAAPHDVTVGYPDQAPPAAPVKDTTTPTTAPASSRLARPGSPAYFREVAGLGVQVAGALQHAHGLGILHRDIKPANLLLDGRGTVWVTDFGLAKLLSQDDLTHPGEFGGTLRYSAPERFQGQSDPRSDVYALGLTLYELLTLRPAFEESDPSRLLRQVMHDEPPPPRRYVPALPRDLETIVLKAIARDPAHRYATAGDLADDLGRFLEDRPIRARRVGPAERLRRWCRRNPALAALTATAVALLVLVAVVATVGYVREGAALRREAEQKARAEANLWLALEAFEAVFRQVVPRDPTLPLDQADEPREPPGRPRVAPQTAAVLQQLLQFYDRFAEQNSDNANLRRVTAKAYWRSGDLQQRLGKFAEAEKAYRRALANYERLEKDFPNEPEPLREMAVLHSDLGVVQQLTLRPGEAQASYERARELLAPGGKEPAAPAERYELARVHQLLGGLVWRSPQGAGAEEHARAAVQLLEQLAQEDPRNPAYQHALARAHQLFYLVLLPRNMFQDALNARGKAIDILEKLVEEHPGDPGIRRDLIDAYLSVGPNVRPEVAENRLERGVEQARELAARNPSVADYQVLLARALTGHAAVLRKASHPAEAEKDYREALTVLERLMAEPSAPVAYRARLAEAASGLGEVLRATGRLAEAESLLEQAVANQEAFQKTVPRSTIVRQQLVQQYESLAAILERLGEKQKAAEAARKAAELRRQVDGRPPGPPPPPKR